MNLEDLRERRRRERQQDSLQPLSESFYADVADYLRELKTAREAAAEEAADPYGDSEVRRLTDELQTAESVVESLYERRVGKVVKHASFAAADMPHEREGLTEEERALFDDLVARIKENRSRVLDTLAGEGKDATDAGGAEPPERGGSAPSAAPAESDDATERPSAEAGGRDDPAGMLADAMGVGGDEGTGSLPSAVEASEDGPAATQARDDTEASDEGATDRSAETDDADERTTVRITADVGEIYGVDDRDYELAAEDVVDLPADNAAPLIEKEAAERLS
ncbi:MAG: hypothetical protein ABEJ43_02255 [Haloferacaceae archaeon]